MSHFYIDTPVLLEIKALQTQYATFSDEVKANIKSSLVNTFQDVGKDQISIFHSSFNRVQFFHEHKPKPMSELVESLFSKEIPDLDDRLLDTSNYWLNVTVNRDKLWPFMLRMAKYTAKIMTQYHN